MSGTQQQMDKVNMSRFEIERYIDTEVMPLIRTMHEMCHKLRTEDKNAPFHGFLNKMVKFSSIARNVFLKEYEEVKRREEEELELDGAMDSVSEYGEDDSGEEDVELVSQRSTFELMSLTRSKGFTSEKKYENIGVQILQSAKSLQAQPA
jgi:hypothetical protein